METKQQLIRNEQLHSGYIVFVRGLAAMPDAEILARFGLVGYAATERSSSQSRHVVLWQTGEWTAIADDLGYTLWHSPIARAAVFELVKQHDVFTCMDGDSDVSFAYQYYVNGVLVRDYVVDSPHYSDRVVRHDLGARLPGENDALRADGEWIALGVARGLGIDTRVTSEMLRLYAPPDRPRTNPIHDL